jgi:hypothetical protein
MSDDVSGIDGTQVLGESDWEDEDLLSIDEASQRLEAEISHLRASLEQQGGGTERDTLATRLGALERVLQSVQAGPTPLATSWRAADGS